MTLAPLDEFLDYCLEQAIKGKLTETEKVLIETLERNQNDLSQKEIFKVESIVKQLNGNDINNTLSDQERTEMYLKHKIAESNKEIKELREKINETKRIADEQIREIKKEMWEEFGKKIKKEKSKAVMETTTAKKILECDCTKENKEYLEKLIQNDYTFNVMEYEEFEESYFSAAEKNRLMCQQDFVNQYLQTNINDKKALYRVEKNLLDDYIQQLVRKR